MGKNKKCEEIKYINRTMFYVIGIIALIIGVGVPFVLTLYQHEQIKFLYKYKGRIFFWVLVWVMVGILFLIKYGDGTIWINEDEYKKMKCKDL